MPIAKVHRISAGSPDDVSGIEAAIAAGRIDPKGVVGYYGAADDKAAPTANPYEANSYIAEFLDAVLAGKEPPTKDTKPYG